MSFFVRIGAVEIVCETLEDLDAVVDRYGPGPTSAASANVTKPAGAAKAASKSPTPPKPKKPEGVSEAAYLKHSWRVIRLLLKEEHRAVGKLTTTLASELKLDRKMLRLVVNRLEIELPKFLDVGDKARGSGAPYVRLTDAKAAEDFATAQEALFQETVKV
jgi:hypothetical protein